MAKKLTPVEAVLQFLRENKIGDGKWCIGVKDQFEKLIELVGEGSDMFTRVWACIYLHTMGYLPTAAGIESHSKKSSTPLNQPLLDQCKHVGGVLAVTSYNGKIIPLTTALIAKELNRYALTAAKKENPELTDDDLLALMIDDEDVRRQVVRMERMGIVLRTDGNDTPLRDLGRDQLVRLNSGKRLGRRRNRADLNDGGNRIYFFLRPRLQKALNSGGFLQGALLHRKDFRQAPPQLESEEAHQLCFDFAARYQLPEEVAAYAERRDVQAKLAALKQKEEELRELLLRIAAAEQQGQLFADTPEARKSPAPANQPHPPKTVGELAPIAAMLDHWQAAHARGEAWDGPLFHYDDAFLKKLFAICRDESPDCTPEEVAWAVNEKFAIKGYKGGPPRGKVKNAWSYLMATVPELFSGDRLQRRRDQREGQRKESPAAAAACPSCEGSGLIGLKLGSGSMTVGEWAERAGEAIRDHGAQYCECPEGETTRMLVEPAVMRRSAS